MGQLVGRLRKTAGEGQRSGIPLPLLWLGSGTLAYTGAGWLDLLAGEDGGPFAALGIFLLLVGGTLLLLRPLMLPRTGLSVDGRGTRTAWRVLLAALTLCALLTLGIAISLFPSAGDTRIYDSDAAAFNHYNAALVLHEKNPYTSDHAFWDALRQFPSAGATPLRAGRYAGSTYGPSLKQVVADTQYELAHPGARGPEYDPASLHSYPALAFLIYVPGVWAGLPTTFYTGLVLLVVFFVAAGWGTPRDTRPAIWLLLAASSLVVFWTLRGSFEVIALLPALMAWRWLDRRWLSPLLLGLGCAVKQLIWPLVPLYAIVVWRREGRRAALVRLAVALGAFLVPNLSFLVASPAAWAKSMLLPVTLPIFPSGVGLVGLARGGLLPLWPPVVYALLTLVTLAALGIWLARTPRAFRPEMALILGLLPLALSWHSLFTYFMCIPALAVAGVIPLLRHDLHSERAMAVADPPSADPLALE